jgi:hypothetical protein
MNYLISLIKSFIEKPMAYKIFQIFQTTYENERSLSYAIMCPLFVVF